jgi:hypothetical protein
VLLKVITRPFARVNVLTTAAQGASRQGVVRHLRHFVSAKARGVSVRVQTRLVCGAICNHIQTAAIAAVFGPAMFIRRNNDRPFAGGKSLDLDQPQFAALGIEAGQALPWRR